MRLLILGDGLMIDASPAIEAGIQSGAVGPSTSENRSYWGFALSKPQWRDWRVLWPQYVAEVAPTVVAVNGNIHDTEPQVVDGVRVDPADPTWPDWFASQVRQAMDDLTAGGAVVYWMGVPPVGDRATNDRVRVLNEITRRVVELDPRGHFVDTTEPFSGPDGLAAATGADGKPLRRNDLLHFCAAGAAVMADLFFTAVGRDTGVSVDSSYLTQPWRTSDQYVADGPPGCQMSPSAP